LEQRLRRALTDLGMALQSQPASALPLCRELVGDVRLNLLGDYSAGMAMHAVREIEQTLRAQRRGRAHRLPHAFAYWS
jgi:hypothetical protein